MFSRSSIPVVSVGLVLALGGCGSTGAGTDPTAKDDVSPLEQLAARPTAEQAAAYLSEQIVRIRAALEELVPNVEWGEDPPSTDGESLCRDPFSTVRDATALGLGVLGGGAIPDKDWDQATEITREILEPEGYDEMTVVANKPGEHDVAFTDGYGSTITIGGQVSTTIDASSGCFLKAASHPEG